MLHILYETETNYRNLAGVMALAGIWNSQNRTDPLLRATTMSTDHKDHSWNSQLSQILVSQQHDRERH